MTLDPAWMRVYRDVGGDRYLTHAELPDDVPPARTLWETYDRMFGRFTGAALDPLFFRFAHGSLRLATPILPPGLPMLIVGTGPSLDAHCDDLRRVRARVMIASSPRGALALQARGLFADLVLIEHQSAFEAEASADTERHDGPARLHPESAVLADPATPPDLLAHLDPARTRLAHALPTWGLWPATLAALALEGGAPMVGLLGIDLGADGHVDPEHRPLNAVLEQIARASSLCRECGHAGPPKKGWPRISLAAFAATSTGASHRVTWRDEQPTTAMFDRASEDLATLQPLMPDAREALELGLRARAGDVPPMRDLTQAIDLMLAWGSDTRLRWVLQRGLGLSFLPRFWRTGVSMTEPHQLWRPVVLALHEMTAQAERLESQLRQGMRRARMVTVGRSAASPMPVASMAPPPISAGEPRRVRTSPVVHATRISVLLPVKNGLPHLHDAVASLASQTHPDLEILVIDDGSEDGGPQEIMAQALSHVRVIRSTGHGLSAALHTGLRAATGAFIARQHPADWSHPERLARQFEYLLRHPDVDLLATTVNLVDPDGHPLEEPPDADWRAIQATTLLARRDPLRDAVDRLLDGAGVSDEDPWQRLLPEARVATLPTRLYRARLTPYGRDRARGC